MDDNDLRNCFAMFAMMGLVMREGVTNDGLEIDAWVMADKMMATKDKDYNQPEEGIVKIKRTRKT
jgi:hypothetical protein